MTVDGPPGMHGQSVPIAVVPMVPQVYGMVQAIRQEQGR